MNHDQKKAAELNQAFLNDELEAIARAGEKITEYVLKEISELISKIPSSPAAASDGLIVEEAEQRESRPKESSGS